MRQPRKGRPFKRGNEHRFRPGEQGRQRLSARFLQIRDDLAGRYGGHDTLDPATQQIIEAAATAKYSAERHPSERSRYLSIFVRCLTLLEPPEARRAHRRVGLGIGPTKPTPSLQAILSDAKARMGAA
jgi:hypothetical protein